MVKTPQAPKRMNITISGLPGSGKTTVAELLHQKLGTRYVYTGQIFREKAEDYHMSLSDFGSFVEDNPKIDQEIDMAQKEILLGDNVILEGRLAGWIAYQNGIPALKVWLDCDLMTRIKRIVRREGTNTKIKRVETLKREESERARYQKIYDIDLRDTSIYDLVIDTSHKKPQEIAHLIIDALNRRNM